MTPGRGPTGSSDSIGCSRSRRSTSGRDVPIDFDCAPVSLCPPDALVEPALDYLARDYASFRQMLLDYVAQRNPTWTERSPADLGIALLELFAYEGDHLSYFQDAVANEAFLDTADSASRRSGTRGSSTTRCTTAAMPGRSCTSPSSAPGAIAAAAGEPPVQLVTRIVSPMRFDRVPLRRPDPAAGHAARNAAARDHRRGLRQRSGAGAGARVRDGRSRRGRSAEQRAAPPFVGQRAVLPGPRDDEGARLRDQRRQSRPAAAESRRLPAARRAARPDDGRRSRCRSDAPAGRADRARQSGSLHRPRPAQRRTRCTIGCSSTCIDPATGQPKTVTLPVPVNQTLPLVEVTWRIG